MLKTRQGRFRQNLLGKKVDKEEVNVRIDSSSVGFL